MDGLFAAFWGAFFDALMSHLPQITKWWKTVNTSTMTDATPAPADVTAGVYQEIQDAAK